MSNLRLKENPTLADLQQYVRDMVAERGFKDDVQNKFMMLIEEVGEFAKASRKHAGMRYATDVREQDLAGGLRTYLSSSSASATCSTSTSNKPSAPKKKRAKKRVWKR